MAAFGTAREGNTIRKASATNRGPEGTFDRVKIRQCDHQCRDARVKKGGRTTRVCDGKGAVDGRERDDIGRGSRRQACGCQSGEAGF